LLKKPTILEVRQYHLVRPFAFSFYFLIDSISVQPVATLSIKLGSSRNRFWSTNFRMLKFSRAIKSYCLIFPQYIDRLLSIKVFVYSFMTQSVM